LKILLQGLAKWFTFSVFENVGVVMFVVAERDNVNFASSPKTGRDDTQQTILQFNTVAVDFY
jgi:hypothetical protein